MNLSALGIAVAMHRLVLTYGPTVRIQQLTDLIYTLIGYPRFVEKYGLLPSSLLLLGGAVLIGILLWRAVVHAAVALSKATSEATGGETDTDPAESESTSLFDDMSMNESETVGHLDHEGPDRHGTPSGTGHTHTPVQGHQRTPETEVSDIFQEPTSEAQSGTATTHQQVDQANDGTTAAATTGTSSSQSTVTADGPVSAESTSSSQGSLPGQPAGGPAGEHGDDSAGEAPAVTEDARNNHIHSVDQLNSILSECRSNLVELTGGMAVAKGASHESSTGSDDDGQPAEGPRSQLAAWCTQISEKLPTEVGSAGDEDEDQDAASDDAAAENTGDGSDGSDADLRDQIAVLADRAQTVQAKFLPTPHEDDSDSGEGIEPGEESPDGQDDTDESLVSVVSDRVEVVLPNGLLADDTDEEDDSEEVNLADAAARLEERGEPLTEDAIREEYHRMQAEQLDTGNSVVDDNVDATTGVVTSRDERHDQTVLSIGPEEVNENPADHFLRRGSDGSQQHVKIFTVIDWPTQAAPGWLDTLFGPGLEVDGVDDRVTIHIDPRDSSAMLDRLTRKQAELTGDVNKSAQDGELDFIEEDQKRKDAERMRQSLVEGSTKMFDVGMYVELVADKEDALKDAEDRLRDLFEQKQARIVPLHGDQLDGMRAMAPDGTQSGFLPTTLLDLASLGTILPFIEPSMIEPGGVLIGYSKSTSNPVIYNRYLHSGYNVLVSGKIGAGKTYVSKLVVLRRLYQNPDTEVTIIDPKNDFEGLVDGLDGQSISISHNTKINPMEIRKIEQEVGEAGNSFQLKIQSVMGLIKTVFDKPLEMEEEGVLRRALKLAYYERGIYDDPRTHDQTPPVLSDVIRILGPLADGRDPIEIVDLPANLPQRVTDQVKSFAPDSERARSDIATHANRVLLGMEKFRKGGQYSNLNGQTNVSFDNQIVQFDLSMVANASSADKTVYMHLIMDWLYQRAKANPQQDNLLTIDECHVLLDEPHTAQILNTFTRHSRHYNTGLTLISQTVDEWLSEGGDDTNYSPVDIYKQCDCRILLYHESLDADEVEELDLNKKEVEFINSATQGDKDGTDHSEALVCTDDQHIRTRVFSYEYELHLLDDDLNIHAFRVATGMDTLDEVPKDEQEDVVRILNEDDPEELALGREQSKGQVVDSRSTAATATADD